MLPDLINSLLYEFSYYKLYYITRPCINSTKKTHLLNRHNHFKLKKKKTVSIKVFLTL